MGACCGYEGDVMNRAMRFTASGLAAVTAVTIAGIPAHADGKAQLGCSSPYVVATIDELILRSQSLVDAGVFTPESLKALLDSLDHNGNLSLCYKVPSGWLGPPATNGAAKAGFVNLVDDKALI